MDVPGGDYLFFGGMILLFGWLATHYARRLSGVNRALRAGIRAEGTCVRIEQEPYNRSDARQHFFAFRTPDGRQIEFEDLASRSIRVGDPVTVAYDPADPDRTATVAGRGHCSPVLQYGVLVVGCGLAAAGFAAVLLFTVV
ncbi:DUF3592 domain-containing protein [Streptomyces niveus]|uniref:DUF3592 domain-containing protein n=1 Tax=Streptomyces niveus TaxID=193462 RepID=UPI0003C59DDC|nr:DUF3592 domain-containing protein [Streptomyces niveus]EST28808.1 hypothetical protein M877_13780 [Streptomyces niveus NCIMB 11891]